VIERCFQERNSAGESLTASSSNLTAF
jgi:hypothetical protein